jgi:hypothetical protein
LLTIRDAQMQVFLQRRRARLDVLLADHLRRRERALLASWSRESLVHGVARARDRAARWGIRDAFAVGEFFVAMVTHGEGFDAHPAVRALLEDPSVAEDHRIHRVWAEVGPAVWADIAAAATSRGPWLEGKG